MPSPDYDAPSPQGEDEMELRLPDEEERHTPPGKVFFCTSVSDPNPYGSDSKLNVRHYRNLKMTRFVQFTFFDNMYCTVHIVNKFFSYNTPKKITTGI
jgi:hypothetical protein